MKYKILIFNFLLGKFLYSAQESIKPVEMNNKSFLDEALSLCNSNSSLSAAESLKQISNEDVKIEDNKELVILPENIITENAQFKLNDQNLGFDEIKKDQEQAKEDIIEILPLSKKTINKQYKNRCNSSRMSEEINRVDHRFFYNL